eukprot:scaffold42167_cov30-Tisochrysis_lutea.AAC.8
MKLGGSLPSCLDRLTNHRNERYLLSEVRARCSRSGWLSQLFVVPRNDDNGIRKCFYSSDQCRPFTQPLLPSKRHPRQVGPSHAKCLCEWALRSLNDGNHWS